MQFGLSQEDIEYIITALQSFPEVKKAFIFGSRAMGNYKNGSDIDIALDGVDINLSTLAKVKSLLQEESPMPYLFDIVDYSHCESEALKLHIAQHGVTLFNKK